MATIKQSQIALTIGLIVITAFSRLLPHPNNFTPIAAIALLSGAIIGPLALRLIIPMAALFLSDAIIGFHSGMPLVYGSMLLAIGIGSTLRNRITASRVVLSSLTASLVFFLVTNFAFFYPTTFYPHNLQGILASYTAGLPFFRNTLIGDLFYSGVLFGVYQFWFRSQSQKQTVS